MHRQGPIRPQPQLAEPVQVAEKPVVSSLYCTLPAPGVPSGPHLSNRNAPDGGCTVSQGRRQPDDLSTFCCQNPPCPDYGKRGHGNLTVPMRYGPQRLRLLRCRTCRARFSERKGTPLFDTRLPPGQVVAVLHHLAEGVGVRKTSRLTGVNKNTVVRYGLRAGEHAQQLHDELVAFSPQHP
jgi:transposase-like protein